MKPENYYNDKNLKEKFEKSQEKFENIEEKGNKRGRFNFDKIKGFLRTLKNGGLKVGNNFIDFLFILLEKIIKSFKRIWNKEADAYRIYIVYRDLVVKLTDYHFKEYSEADDFNSREKWMDKADEYSIVVTSDIPKIPFHSILVFAFKSLIYDTKYLIIFILLILGIFLSFLISNSFGEIDLPTIILLFITNNADKLFPSIVGFLILIYFIEIKKVKHLIDNNEEYYNDIWKVTINGYNKIVKANNERCKMDKDKDGIEVSKSIQSQEQQFLNLPQEQQYKEEEFYNPYADMWKEINAKYFKLDDFKIPEYEKLELIERHIIHDYDLKEEDVVKISENIEKYRGIPINIIKSKDGKIVVDFLIGKFPNLIPFNEVPKVDENFIVVGKSAEGWVTWNLKTAPHGLIIGATGSGKSNTVRFVFNEFQKKDEYLMYVIDFKGGSDYYFLDGKYDLITDTEEFIDFIKKLGSELAYRQKLFKDLRSSEINNVNHLLIKKGKNIIPNLMIFIDEFAFVSSLPKDVKSSIIKNIEQLMQRGRSFGIHFTLIVQQPTAENLGSSYIRSLIGFRLIGKLEDEADYEKSFGASNTLKGQDKVFAEKMKNEADFLGKFIVKGGHMENKPLGRNVIVRIPFMDVGDYNEMVQYEWEDNPYADYQLHYDDEENDEVLNKVYGEGTDNIVEADYEVIDEDEDDIIEDVEEIIININDFM